MDYIVHGVAKSQTRLSDLHFHFPYLCPSDTTSVDEGSPCA